MTRFDEWRLMIKYFSRSKSSHNVMANKSSKRFIFVPSSWISRACRSWGSPRDLLDDGSVSQL